MSIISIICTALRDLIFLFINEPRAPATSKILWRRAAIESGAAAAKIPRIIIQTHETNEVSFETFVATRQLIHMNPDYAYRFFDSEKRRAYIAKNMPAVLGAYDKLGHGTYQADLFRYCVLYVNGGVYIDCKSTCVEPLSRFIPDEATFVAFVDCIPFRLATSFLACTARHPLMGEFLRACAQHATSEDYGENQLDMGGPETCGKIINEILGQKPADSLAIGRAEVVHAPTGATYSFDLVGWRHFFSEYFFVDERAPTPVFRRIYNGFWWSWAHLRNRYELWWALQCVFRS